MDSWIVITGWFEKSGIRKIAGTEFTVSYCYWKEEFPKLPRTIEDFLLPDIEYPWSVEHRLNIEDCKKIIKLKRKLKSK